MNSRQHTCLDLALQYAGRGWHVFPVPPNTKKSYKKAADHGGRNWGATTDPAEIQRDFKHWPQAGLGVVTGAKSGVFVLETDTPKGGHRHDGAAALRTLQAEHGALPKTLMAASPSGSQHYYFRQPAGSLIKNSDSEIADGVDIRGDGGMVVAPPTVRKDGQYKWINRLPIAAAPDWLIELCKKDAPVEKNPFTQNRNFPPAEPEEIAAAGAHIPNKDDSWEKFNLIGMCCWAAFRGSEEGYTIFDAWAAKSKAKYNAKQTREKWNKFRKSPPDRIGEGKLFKLAEEASPGWRKKQTDRLRFDEFLAYMPDHDYVFLPTLEHWPAVSVNSQLAPQPKLDKNGKKILDKNGKQVFIPANVWLDHNSPVEQITWCPGEPRLVRGRIVVEGGWINEPEKNTLNLYRAPTIDEAGDIRKVAPWLRLLKHVYPNDWQHLLNFFAHRVQKADEKINHGLVLGGAQGIGKDTILEPLRYAVGHWNFIDISPSAVMGRFNAHVKSVVLRISEARDLGDISRYTFYEHMKTLLSSPPNVLTCDEKYTRAYSIFNVTGVIITTNHLTDGIYIPEDDRRHYVAWSKTLKDDFEDRFWSDLWRWYASEGFNHVAAYLSQYDISKFDAKEPPPKTEAFWAIVNSHRSSEEAELSTLIEGLRAPGKNVSPDILTLNMLRKAAEHDAEGLFDWLSDRKNRRLVGFRLEKCGYEALRNPDAEDGYWKVDGKRQVVYARSELDRSKQLGAAYTLVRKSLETPPKPRLV